MTLLLFSIGLIYFVYSPQCLITFDSQLFSITYEGVFVLSSKLQTLHKALYIKSLFWAILNVLICSNIIAITTQKFSISRW